MSTEVMSGWVTKCGNSVKSWKRRWFVLKHNGFLYYYENSNMKSEKGKIDVPNCKMIGPWSQVATADKIPSAFSSSNAFAIVAHERTYTCVCDKDEECRAWIAALNKCKDGTSDQQYPDPTYQNNQEQEAPALPDKPPPYSPAVPPPVAPVSPPTQPPPYAPSQPAQAQRLSAAFPNPYPPQPQPQAQQRSASFTALPMAGPGFTQSYPVGNYQPPNPPPPAQSYRQPPQQPGYPPAQPYPQANYPPAQPYRQPPQQPGYAPPRPLAQPYPQPGYAPPRPLAQPYPQPGYAPRPPYHPPPQQPYYQRPPPAPYQPRPVYYPPPQHVTRRTTNVTVVTIPAPQQQRIIYRRR